MPCRDGGVAPVSASERTRIAQEKFDSLNERASLGGDLLREYLLGNVAVQRILPLLNQKLEEEIKNLRDTHLVSAIEFDRVCDLVGEYEELNTLVTSIGKDTLSAKDKVVIEQRQIQHRNEDLIRLMKTFADSGDRDRLRVVIDADPNKPLQAQLGFDPDEF